VTQRAASRLIAAAVVVVAAVAVVDAFRSSGGDEREAEAPVLTRPPAAGVESRIAIADRLRHEGIGGRLLYTDDSCTLRAVSLPDLESAATPGVRALGCSFSASPDGERAAAPGAAWSPDSRRVALCRASAVVVSVASERAPAVERHDGCTPAWRPDGVLTFVRESEVVDVSGSRIVTSRAIEVAARRHLIAPDPPELAISYEIVDVAWLSARRLALLLRLTFTSAGREFDPEMQVAIFEDGGVVGTEDGLGDTWTRLDGRNGLVAVRPGVLIDARGRRLYPVPGTGIGGANAVAVAPDGRWVAVGLRGRVTLLSIPALRAGRFRSVSLPFAARDLAWR
jgi:hypothetical protein